MGRESHTTTTPLQCSTTSSRENQSSPSMASRTERRNGSVSQFHLSVLMLLTWAVKMRMSSFCGTMFHSLTRLIQTTTITGFGWRMSWREILFYKIKNRNILLYMVILGLMYNVHFFVFCVFKNLKKMN